MRQIHVAIALVKQGNKYLLQLRDGPRKIGGAGLVGCFGGKIDEGEKALETIVRELAEEMGITPQKEELSHIGEVEVESDHNLEAVRVNLQVFHVAVPRSMQIVINEGKLVTMTKQQALKNLHNFTPGTRAAFEELL